MSPPSVLIRQCRHPRVKATNDHVVPFIADAGYDAVTLIKEQFEMVSPLGTFFPYCARSVGAAFG
jgi:hypothetical protein